MTARLKEEYPNVLEMLTDEQWIGTEDDIVQSIRLLVNVWSARKEETSIEDRGWDYRLPEKYQARVPGRAM